MASAHESDSETSSESDSDVSDESDNEIVHIGTDSQAEERAPCKFYNSGHCREGNRCPYLHVCKYALRGNCRYGAKCKLSHNIGGSNWNEEEEETTDLKLTDGRYYQWQLNDGNNWLDVDNDHVIEAQYSLPHTKSIKIYNTSYGAVNIDFHKLRVRGKHLRVRRLDDGNTVWLWYCTLRRKWNKYGDKDSKGNASPVNSADIESKFQSNPKSSFTFSIGAETLEIRFGEMRQVSKNRKRRVTRRPLFRHPQAIAGVPALQNLSLGTTPLWQFEGNSGTWHDFKRRRGTSTECSITSDEIERKYQQNSNDSMTFKVNGNSYKLDFRAMTQTNLRSNHSRRVRRMLV